MSTDYITQSDSQDDLQPIPPEDWPPGPLSIDEEFGLDTNEDGSVLYWRDLHCPKCGSYELSEVSKSRPLSDGKPGEREHRRKCLDCQHPFAVVILRPRVRLPDWPDGEFLE